MRIHAFTSATVLAAIFLGCGCGTERSINSSTDGGASEASGAGPGGQGSDDAATANANDADATGGNGAGDGGTGPGESRSITNFNPGWKFYEGDPTGAQDLGFNDSSWQALSVPHDWINAKGLKDGSGTAWYRKHFTLAPTDSGKKVFIDFDGIFHRSTVYVNGTQVGECSYGYTPLVYDITSHIKYTGENVVAVKVNTGDASTQSDRSSRWYGGGGITRNVRLRITDMVHVDNRGTYITTPTLSTTSATVNIRTTVKNDNSSDQAVTLRTTITDVNGAVVTQLESSHAVTATASYEFNQNLTVASPTLWDTSNPALYHARSEVVLGSTVVDAYDSTFGIRTITWDPNQGLLLNGKVIKIKGGCVHDDLGILGTAFDERGWERRLQTMKEIGFNGVRTSHNARPREFLALCDRLGIMVFDEMFDSWTTAIYPNFDTDWQRDLSAAVLRDRNHPSVYIWSVGNEAPDQSNPTAWADKYNRMAQWLHTNDPTRKVTTALRPDWSPEDAQLEDVISLNYGDNGKYRSTIPQGIIIDSENYIDWGDPWPGVLSTNYLVGMHLWAAIDYRGEGSQWGWNGAIIDVSGSPKAISSLYRAHWSDDGVMRIVVEDSGVPMPAATCLSYWYWSNMGDHWTLPNLDGKQVTVKTYTNCTDIELFVNDVSQGTKQMTDSSNVVSWSVKYQAGTIKAVGKIGGTTKCSQTLTTAGATAKIVLKPDRSRIKADGVDRAYVEVDVVDANGVLVPSASNQLTFDVTGPGAVVAKGNADMGGNILASAAFYGKAVGVVQSTGTAGDIVLIVSSPGLTSANLTIPASTSSATVPYLFGLSQGDAEAKIASAGLTSGNGAREYSSAFPAGSVVRQNPVYGASVAAGSPVNLVISNGSR